MEACGGAGAAGVGRAPPWSGVGKGKGRAGMITGAGVGVNWAANAMGRSGHNPGPSVPKLNSSNRSASARIS